ncbi:hypothetical protein pb186bvf_011479 [Paramecium bursaria]
MQLCNYATILQQNMLQNMLTFDDLSLIIIFSQNYKHSNINQNFFFLIFISFIFQFDILRPTRFEGLERQKSINTVRDSEINSDSKRLN